MCKKYFKFFIKNILTYIIFLISWQLVLYLFNTPNYIVPSPLSIFYYVLQYYNILITNVIVTIIESVLGLIAAIITSIFLGIIALYNSYFIKVIFKILLVIQIIPLLAIAPIITIWLGFSIFTKILIVLIVCLFPCLVSFLSGYNNIDKEYFSLLQSMGANKWQIFKITFIK